MTGTNNIDDDSAFIPCIFARYYICASHDKYIIATIY